MIRNKHILFIVENNPFPQDVRVYKEAMAAREFGYEVSVISPYLPKWTDKKFEVVNGIDVYRHPMPHEGEGKSGLLFEYGNALFWEILLSLWVFIRKPFHMIHSANPPDHIFILAWFYKLFGVKYVFDHHDICPENYLAKFNRKDILYKFLLLFEKLTFKTADLVVSTNDSYKELAITRGGKKKEDVFVVRNGPDLSQVIFQPPNNKWKTGFDYLVGYVGTIGNQEGIDGLLRSVDYIVHTKGIKNIKFIIVGTGTDWQNMVDLSQEMGLTEYVHFTGFVPYEDFYEIIATSDVCVNPEFRNSFTDKSTMIKIMDYVVFEKPIVQYYTTEGHVTAGDAAEYVYENDEVVFAETLLKVLYAPEKRARMGSAARKRLEEFLLWDHQKNNLKKAYDYLNWKRERFVQIKFYTRLYYWMKPVFPRKIQLFFRRVRLNSLRHRYRNVWPICERAGSPPDVWKGWPDNKKFALVLTHDVDTARGCKRVKPLMQIEKDLGFRSGFFFVPEAYGNSMALHHELLDSGFEIGVHGLNHDGKLYQSLKTFNKRAARINDYIASWNATGFRSPCMHHNLKWLMQLNVTYDASTYDTDPFEPQGGGMATIYPFIVRDDQSDRSYVELPYTLPQDHLLFVMMKENNIDIWKKKIDWIVDKGGMILVNTHPDYISLNGNSPERDTYPSQLYINFLKYLKTTYEGQYWHALPIEMATFWKQEMGHVVMNV